MQEDDSGTRGVTVKPTGVDSTKLGWPQTARAHFTNVGPDNERDGEQTLHKVPQTLFSFVCTRAICTGTHTGINRDIYYFLFSRVSSVWHKYTSCTLDEDTPRQRRLNRMCPSEEVSSCTRARFVFLDLSLVTRRCQYRPNNSWWQRVCYWLPTSGRYKKERPNRQVKLASQA